ncbi:MAG: hypothetical protein P4N59_10640 [Negativicutes bacterium]|nr:hypothetical protein [Negativicutes bacterium]
MSGNKRKIDSKSPNQTSLFDIIDEITNLKKTEPEPGSINLSQRVKEAMSSALKACTVKRYEIVGRMSEYTGAEITESMLNSWTAESKEGHRFPLEYLAAFCWATSNFDLLDMSVRACGCHLVRSEDVALLELARIDEAKRQLTQKEKYVRGYLDRMRHGSEANK